MCVCRGNFVEIDFGCLIVVIFCACSMGCRCRYFDFYGFSFVELNCSWDVAMAVVSMETSELNNFIVVLWRIFLSNGEKSFRQRDYGVNLHYFDE